MPRFAADTSVSTESSRNEIERTLRRYGADEFVYGWRANAAMIGFAYRNRQVQFLLPLPAKDEQRFLVTERRGTARDAATAERLWEQACRQAWRALNLVIKAKLEAVESAITTFDEEFLAHLVLPDGRAVGASIIPGIVKAYETGQTVPLLPFLQSPDSRLQTQDSQ